jgi:Fe-S-cluster containining protein
MHTIIDAIRRPGAPKPSVTIPECATCPGHCCKGDTIALHPEHGDVVAIYRTTPMVHPLTGELAYMLAHKPNGDCTYFEEVGGIGRCGIYAGRPVICRSFDCGLAYAKLGRPERRRLVREGRASAAVFAMGQRVQAARAAKNAPGRP